MAEAGDPGIGAGKVTPAAALRPYHQFDMIPGRIAKADERPYLALLGFLRSSCMNGVPELFQRRGRLLQACLVLDLEADGLVVRIAFRIAQRMGAFVGAQIEVLLAAFGNLEAEIGGRKILRRFEI